MPGAFRSLLGPALLAVGAWCAAGTVALPAADDLTTRMISVAPWWVFLAALGAAWLIPSCRRHPGLASPALLTVLPWLPLPLPAAALIWTGRLAWVPVALALVAMVRTSRGRHDDDGNSRGPTTLPVGDIGIAAILTGVALVAAAWSLSPRLPGGDEPHYLIITQSLLQDHDLEIENNHQARDYASYFRGTLNPDFLHRGRNEVIYSIHAPGLPVLVAPLFAAFGYRGAQGTVMICAVLTGMLVWASGWLATRSRAAAWFAWAAITSSVTFLIQGVTIFPDGPAALVVAGATLVSLRFERQMTVSRRTLVVLSAGLGALPFLHTRLATVSAGVGAAVVWALVVEVGQSSAERRRRIGAFLAVPVLALVAWLGYFEVLYGTPNPAIAYGTHPETRAAYIPGGVLGLFFDQDFGLLTFAPALGAAVVGFVRRKQAGATGRLMLPGALLYLGAVGTYWMWWAGTPATPARFAAAVLPVLAPGLAVVWSRSARVGRTVLLSLVTGTLAVSAAILAVDRGALAWNAYDAHAPWLLWLETSTNLARAVPSFFWDLDPGVVASESPFARHVAAAAAVVVVMAVIAGRLGRRARVPEVLAAWAVAGGVMVCAQSGWWMTAAPSLQPIGGQVRLLRALSQGRSGWALSIAERSVTKVRPEDLHLEVARADMARPGPAAWLPIAGLPAGTYDLTVVERRPTGGELTLKLADGRVLSTFALDRRTEQTVQLSLPSAARSLSVEPDPVLSGSAQRLWIRPVSLPPGE